MQTTWKFRTPAEFLFCEEMKAKAGTSRSAQCRKENDKYLK
jgi:hypothetical protein